MINPRIITVSAGIGFCLSFLIGLIFKVSFLSLLFRAVIFALVFAVVAAIACIVFDKFLSNGSNYDSELAKDSSSSSTGSVVNITVDDDNLPDDDYAPKFSVGNNRQALSSSVFGGDEKSSVDDISKENNSVNEAEPSGDNNVVDSSSVANGSKSASASQNQDGSFKPVSLADVSKPSENTAASKGSSNVLDDLPDIGELPSNVSSGSESVDVPKSSDSSSGSTSSSDQNTQLMAQAIKTLLAKDED